MTKKNLTSEDCDLFREAVGNVQPVKTDKIHFSPPEKPKPYPKRRLVDDFSVFSDGYDHGVAIVGREDALSFVVNDAPKTILRNLRLGYFGLDAEIDLHGLSRVEAKRQLLSFLQDCVKEGCRCVHIVHGKGYRSQDDPYPILKNHINVWLRQHPDVQAFCSAAPKDGGTGAIYVLLYH